MKNENLMTRSAVARDLRASESAVRNWAVTGKLPCITTTTGRRLFRESDVQKFKEQQRREAE